MSVTSADRTRMESSREAIVGSRSSRSDTPCASIHEEVKQYRKALLPLPKQQRSSGSREHGPTGLDVH